MPGNKITMLPDAVVQNYTLAGGVDCPAVSLYLTVNESLEILSHESRLEMVHIAANLRHHEKMCIRDRSATLGRDVW